MAIAFLIVGGLVGDRGRQRNCVGLQVGHGGLQRGDGGRVVGHRLLLRVGCGLSLGRCRLGIGCRLLRLLQLRILVGQIGLQAVDLALEFLPQSLNLIFNRWLRRLLGFLVAMCFFAGAWGSPA